MYTNAEASSVKFLSRLSFQRYQRDPLVLSRDDNRPVGEDATQHGHHHQAQKEQQPLTPHRLWVSRVTDALRYFDSSLFGL